MADKTIGQLPAIASLDDASLIPVEQSGSAGKMTGLQFKTFAQNAVAAQVTRAEDAADDAEDSADRAAQVVVNVQTQVAEALTAATNAENAVAEAENDITNLEQADAAMSLILAGKVDDAYVEDGYLYLTSNGSIVAGPIGPFAGGGGSGGGNNAVLTVTNETGWISRTIADGDACSITLSWSSIEDELPTGNGTLQISVNSVVRASLDVAQGRVTHDVGPYLSSGSNVVKVTISDIYGNSRTINFSVMSIALSLSSTFDTTSPFQGAILFPYTPVGNVEKTVYFVLDGTTIGTTTTSVSGRQMTYTIPQQSHGAHTLRVYFEASINGQTVRSNELYYEMICVEIGNDTPIITSNYHESTVPQYTTIQLDFTVYDPTDLTADVELYANNTLISEQTVDRSQQVYAYRADTVGALTFRIVSGTASKTISLTVTETSIDVEAETDSLALYLSSAGRSNNEANPGTWTYGNIAATFTGFNFTSDGWQHDSDGITVLRVAGDARLTIPYQPFAQDFRTSGKTIEIEFATRDVMNYDSVILSCMSGGRGISLTAQKATLTSEQSEISMQYKEDEHVRLAFAVEKRSENRLLYIYVNGIMSGVVQYPDDDDFSQVSPVNISVGSNDCTIDLYCIRVYDNDLTSQQILNNWIADTQVGADMLTRYTRNNVYDAYGNIVIAQLPNDLPYLILQGPELPQSKGDKKTMSGSYTDPVYSSRSFTFTGAQVDVQGTSSQYYARKNYKIKFQNGFTLSSGNHADTYAMNSDAIPTNTFTFKADVASSEGANNVELARLYNDACPYRTPPQIENSKVRQGIDGFPVVVFWSDGVTTTFLGKYNFNNDKGTEEVFGFAEGDESWEIKNNTSDRVIWKSADYTGDDWLNDFEGRYPDGNTDPTNLSALAAWLVSTDQDQATGDALAEAVVYDETSYTHDTAAYRLAKFKAELSDHMETQAVLFYYLFTELFLMVDSRAKNAFPTFYGTDKWFSLPYDFDTAIGINNEGALVFSYNLEDIDHTTGGADIFNGQDSVLWVNLRQAFFPELTAMYQNLRSTGALSYSKVETMFETHQAKWPEAIFNADAYFKYLQPLFDDGSSAYLSMLQGSKAEQRKWWLYNRFRYMDSKYNAGDALTDVITLRGYAKDNITVTPYADVYASVKYGSYLVQSRAARNVPVTLVCPLDNVNDTEIYVYSASQLASIGDISGLKVGYAEFSNATKLQTLKIGDSSASYDNGNLTELYLGNNVLLRTLDVRNCSGLGTGDQKSVDLSGCSNIENVYFDGTVISGVTLPNGGILKVLHLPGTITNLTIRNQTGITDLTVPSYANLSTLRLENTNVNSKSILMSTPSNARVRLIGFAWEAEDAEEIEEIMDKLDAMRGLDENGNNMETAQVSGSIHTSALTGSQIAGWAERYPHITVTADHTTSYLYYYNYDGSELLHTETILDGGDGTYAGQPSRASTAQYTYTFAGWSRSANQTTADATATEDVVADRNVYAAYTATVRTYTVRYYNGTTLLQTVNNVAYGGSATYTGETPTYASDPTNFEFTGWSPTGTNITGDTNCYAQFRDKRSVTVAYLARTITEYNSDSNTKFATDGFASATALTSAAAPATAVEEYAFRSCTNLTTVELSGTAAATIAANAFNGCTKLEALILRSTSMSTLSATSAFTGTKIAAGSGAIYVPAALVDTYKANSNWSGYYIASIDDYPVTDFSTITDSWAEIFAAEDDGTYATKYSVGDTKQITINGVTDYMQIVAMNADTLADNTGTAKITWISKGMFTTHRMNATAVTTDGWAATEMRTWLRDTILPTLDSTIQANIKTVTKTYKDVTTSSTLSLSDTVWIPSGREIFGGTTYEDSGCDYTGYFNSATRRIKYNTSGSASGWWLRSANSATNFYNVNSGGNSHNSSANGAYGVALGFCT